MTLLKKTGPSEDEIKEGVRDYVACGFDAFNPQPKDIIDTVSYEEVLRYFGKRFRTMLLEINATIPRFKNAKWLETTGNNPYDNPDWEEMDPQDRLDAWDSRTVHSLIDDLEIIVVALGKKRRLDLYKLDDGEKSGSIQDSVGMGFFSVKPFSKEDVFTFGMGGGRLKSATPVWGDSVYFSMWMPQQYLWGTHTNPFDFSVQEFVQMMDIMTFHFNPSWGRLNGNYPHILIPAVPTHHGYTYQVFPHREPAGWFTYVDAYVTKKQIPEAAKIYHLRAGGSLILATHQYLSVYNEQHIITANKIELRLYQLGLLPEDRLSYRGTPIPLSGVKDGRAVPPRPQNEITIEE
jgi:hypothetical protein